MGRDRLRRVRSAALRLLVPLLTQTVGRLPYGGLRRCAKALAWLLLKTNRRYRERSAKHLALAFPEASAGELQELQRGCFLNASLNALETMQLLARGRQAFDRRLLIEGWENVEREKGNRLLLLTCHSGFWELLGVATARQGLALFAVGRRPDEAVIGDLVRRVRA
ncbi:MAG: hypothetical protein O7A04_06590, partial [Acidobacteria bacterium]|nr:hypothetical protein [Acidobacteriota bacterium]